MQRSAVFLFLSLFSQGLTAETIEKPSNIKHSSLKPVVYVEPGEKGEFETMSDVEHYFRVGVAECESHNCKKELVCLTELKANIRQSVQNLYRSNTQKISKILRDIDESREVCEEVLAKEELTTKKSFSFYSLKTFSESPKEPIRKPSLPQITHLKGFL
jgi:hypothetical protein